MDEFLSRIQESINTIDGQLEFEDVASRMAKLAVTSANIESFKTIMNDFLGLRELTPSQTESMVRIFIPWVGETKDGSDLSEVLTALLRVLEACDRLPASVPGILHGEMRLLDLLIHEDVYVRYHSIQIAKKLALSPGHRITVALISRPDILADLVDMARFADTLEFVRNEAISLLFRLSADPHSTQLHSILVFQGLSDIIFDLLIGEEEELPSISSEAIDCLFRLCRNAQSSRYIRESGGCDRISQYIAYALAPVLDHAQGIALEEDPEALQDRVDKGWDLADRMLHVAELLIDKNVFATNGLVSTLCICGESLFLSAEARARCYSFIARLMTEETANEFVDWDDSMAQMPVLWSLFAQLVDERTPLAVRGSIDLIIYSLCQCSPEAQQKLASMLGTTLALEDETDNPAVYYIAQSPGRTVSSVLSHAASEYVGESIPDGSALSEQTWFSLRALSHFARGNMELQRSILNVRISESLTVGQALVKLAKSHQSGRTVVSGAIAVIAEVAGSTTLASAVMADLELLKFLVNSAAKDSNKFSAVLLGLMMMFGDSLSSETLVSVVLRRDDLGLPKLMKLIDEMASEKPKEIIKTLPVTPVGFSEFLAVHTPAMRTAILERYLDISPGEVPDERDALLKQQQARIGTLENELETAKNDFSDLIFSINSSEKDFVLRENAAMKSLLRQLQNELRVVEAESERIRKIHEVETATLKRAMEEYQVQINALLLNNKQLSELHSVDSTADFEKDHADLLELLRVVAERFPETQSVLGPLGRF